MGSRRSYGGKSPENTTFQKQNRFPPREVGQPSALGGRSFEANAFVMFPARGDAPIARNIDRVRRGRGHRTDREYSKGGSSGISSPHRDDGDVVVLPPGSRGIGDLPGGERTDFARALETEQLAL